MVHTLYTPYFILLQTCFFSIFSLTRFPCMLRPNSFICYRYKNGTIQFTRYKLFLYTICIVFTVVYNISFSSLSIETTNSFGQMMLYLSFVKVLSHAPKTNNGLEVVQHHPSLVVFLHWTLPSICHWTYFHTSKGHVTWIIKKVNRIPTHCGVANESVCSLARGHVIRVWYNICLSIVSYWCLSANSLIIVQ